MKIQPYTIEGIIERLGSYIEESPDKGVIGIRETVGEIGDIFCIFGGAWALAGCRKEGIDELVCVALSEKSPVWTGTAVYVLASLATGLCQRPNYGSCPKFILDKLQRVYAEEPDLAVYARMQLREISVRADEEHLLELLQGGLGADATEEHIVQQEIVRIFSTRWFTISAGVIREYLQLINENDNDEAFFQRWFTAHPQMLDPMVVSIWPTPNLRGSKIPDFVLQRFDNTYMIVEIKKPTTTLVTRGGRISAAVNSALEQVDEYARYMRKLPELEWLLPGIDHIECLVVAGIESTLSENQVDALRNANMRHSGRRTVGFDWLARRAQAIHANLLQERVQVATLRTS